ncbi:hypothetical protein [Lentzea guizhouensis]|uniref:hypothetical protein n=1 Tax=Lentzea guizhouensis TaxID=1586287 RepID=UPI001F32EF06|nr:hypothetical protein [Lentzea guizhouensis]
MVAEVRTGRSRRGGRAASRDPADPDHRRRFATEAAALRVAGDHRCLRALLAADLDGAGSGDRCTGLVDWDCAGAGPPGVDLGGARFDAALLFGLPAADHVLEGWQRGAGRRAEQVAYWDVVAAVNSLADMSFCLPALHDQGRPDLDADLLRHRRDAFLSTALNRLDAGGRQQAIEDRSISSKG